MQWVQNTLGRQLLVHKKQNRLKKQKTKKYINKSKNVKKDLKSTKIPPRCQLLIQKIRRAKNEKRAKNAKRAKTQKGQKEQ